MKSVKNSLEIAKMREACQMAGTILELMISAVQPDVSTEDIDQFGKKLMIDFGVKSAAYRYKSSSAQPYPAYTCICINDEIVHGIPSSKRVIKLGDIVSVDVAVVCDGFIGDNAKTIPVGPVSELAANLIKSTEESFFEGIKFATPEFRVGDISFAIQKYVESKGFNVVLDFAGHGIGRSIHESPEIPNYGRPNTGPRLRPGMTLAIEPMVNAGAADLKIDADGWTARTKDGSLSSHFEHTILITENQPEILTISKKELVESKKFDSVKL